MGYKVYRVECLIDDSFGSKPEEMRQNININIDKKDERLVDIILKITAESESKSFTFHLEIKGRFKGSSAVTDDEFGKFCSINAPAILYPYARSIVASYTALANFPTIRLPLVSFIPQKSTEETPDKIAEE